MSHTKRMKKKNKKITLCSDVFNDNSNIARSDAEPLPCRSQPHFLPSYVADANAQTMHVFVRFLLEILQTTSEQRKAG